MDRILKILKKENGPRASSAPALELNTIIFKHVYWYMQQISGERLQDHWSSGYLSTTFVILLHILILSLLNSSGLKNSLTNMNTFLFFRLLCIE